MVMDGEGGEDVSLVADLVASPDTSTWTRLEREGTDEIVREGLPETLRSSLFLSEDQRTAFDVVTVPPGTFVRIGDEFYGPVAPDPDEIPWYISAVPTTLGFPTVSSSSVLGMLGKWRVGGTVKTVVISQDLIAYVASGIVKALGADLTATIASSIRPGTVAADVIHEGLQTSLGELLAEKASKCGFWVRMPSDESGPLVLLPGVQHPLIEKTLALQEALTSQAAAGHIKLFPRDGDHTLILPASPLTPLAEETVGLAVGKVIEMGTIFSFIAPPDEAAVDRAIDLAMSRAASALGYFILPHEIIDVKPPNFQSHVDEGVQALRRGVLDKIGHFPTLKQLLPEYHLDFYGTGAQWLAASLKNAPRRHAPRVLGLAMKVLGFGGGAIVLTPRLNAAGELIPPGDWYGTRTANVFQKMLSK